MTDIQTWLESRDLGKYAEAFVAQDITPDLLADLSDADLRELGIASLGDRKRLQKALAGASAPAPLPAAATVLVAAEPSAPPTAAAPAVADEGERRHATVMFSDLTGYTALNESFDPEEVESIMARIKREAVAVIERHGGRVNQFVGDEVMALFGIPVARRDDPRRAVALRDAGERQEPSLRLAIVRGCGVRLCEKEAEVEARLALGGKQRGDRVTRSCVAANGTVRVASGSHLIDNRKRAVGVRHEYAYSGIYVPARRR